MFDGVDGEQQPADDEEMSPRAFSRLAFFPALLVFGALILLLHSYPWRWQASIACAYTVSVFLSALATGKKDLDDITGDALVFRKISSLLVPHSLVLVVLVASVTEWFRLKPSLPDWLIHEGPKGSGWQIFGWMLLVLASIIEGSWLAVRIKRRFPNSEDAD